MNAIEFRWRGSPQTGGCNAASLEGRLERKGTVKPRRAPTVGWNKQNGLKCIGRGHPSRAELPKCLLVRQRIMRLKPLYLTNAAQ